MGGVEPEPGLEEGGEGEAEGVESGGGEDWRRCPWMESVHGGRWCCGEGE